MIDGNEATGNNNQCNTIDPNLATEPITCRRILAETRKRKKDMNHCESIILEELLYPYKVDDFLNHSFRKHAVHVRWKSSSSLSSSVEDTAMKLPPNNTTKTNHHHQRQKKHVRFPNVPMLQDLMDNPDIPSLVRETSSEAVFVWLLKPNAQDYPPRNGAGPDTEEELLPPHLPPLIQSIEISEPETAIKLHELGGHALYFRAPPTIEQTLVASLLKSTGLGCGQYDNTKMHTSLGRGEVEVFVGGRHQQHHLSPNRMDHPHPTKNHFVTGWHYDFQENFTIQISGVKRWTLHPGIVKHPLRGCTPHYDITSASSVMESQVLSSRLANETLQSPTSMITSTNSDLNTTSKTWSSSSKVEIVDMYPGDVLYFPAGMWHTVETIESGLSINISLMASNFASITCQALQHFLLQNEEWRQCIQNRNGSAVEQLQQLVESLPNILQTAIDSNKFSASMILPPVLHQPTSVDFREPSVDDDGDDNIDEVEDEGDIEADETDAVVKINDIVLPEIMIDGVDIFKQWPVNSHQLCKNSLATLLHEEHEIRQCFTKFQPFQSDHHYFPTSADGTSGSSTDTYSIYVLNVNFAGNESHESLIRHRLLLNDSVLQEIHHFVSRTSALSSDIDRHTKHHINCLVYYGYLSWEKVK
jgi:hypothetical protein